jgi:hypothetical protein
VRGCAEYLSLVCVALLPYFCVSFVIIIVRARGSKLWRFLANGRKTIRRKPWYSSRSLDRFKGVEYNPHPLGRHNVEVGKCYLAEPRDKNRVSRVLLLVIVLFARACSIAT